LADFAIRLIWACGLCFRPRLWRIVASVKARISDLGGTGSPSPADFVKLIAEKTEKSRQVIRKANIRQDRAGEPGGAIRRAGSSTLLRHRAAV
jgi:hypothetical protein